MKFKELPVDHYFQFKSNLDAIYQKLSAGRIRTLGQHGIIRYFKNEAIEDLGHDFAELVEPIHIRARKRN